MMFAGLYLVSSLLVGKAHQRMVARMIPIARRRGWLKPSDLG